MTSPMLILENAKLTFRRATGDTTDPNTGNVIESQVELLEARAYIKRSTNQRQEKPGADTNSFRVKGYTIEPMNLPEWCVNAQAKVPCWIKGVGNGLFQWEPKIHVAKDIVEAAAGTQIQGTFVLEGGLNETNPE